jgi:ribosomal protein S18 acetylase RimI-like enzyme
MNIENCTKTNFDYIVSNVNKYWGSDRTLYLHHPILLYEFGNTAFVARESGNIFGYLFGLYSQKDPYAYVQLVAVHETCRKQGIGKGLYQHFIDRAKENGCTHMKAITTLSNNESVRFHKALGFELIGKECCSGLNYVKDYSGPNGDRVVFLRKI